MRKSHSTQRRFDCEAIENVELNLQCRDEIIPVLFALQHVYRNTELREKVLRLIGQDVNAKSSPQRGRNGFWYWQIVVLAAVRLGCKLDYDRLQDLAEK